MLPQQPTPAQYYSNTSQYVNGYPSQSTQNVNPGPSTSTSQPLPSQQTMLDIHDSSSTNKQRTAPRSKRKRGNSVTDNNADNSPGAGSSSANGIQKTASKKKKANRACFHCQKAHLTCDDSRPCQRCIKRGIGDKCMEGIRKKAKYLLDEDELAALKQQQQQNKICEKSATAVEPSNHSPSISSPRPPDPPSNPPSMTDQDPLFNLAFDPAYTFGSEAANLEYSILSAILGNPSPPDDNSRLLRNSEPHSQTASTTINGPSYPQFANPEWPAPPAPQQPPTPSKPVSPVMAPNFLPTQDPSSYPSTMPYRPPLAHGQSYNSTSTAYRPSPSAVAHSPPGVMPATQSLQQPQAQMHYPQPAWSETTSNVPPMDGLMAADTSYMRTNVSIQPQSIPYHVDAQGQDGAVSNQAQGLPPLSPPPSNSSPGTPLATESSFSFHAQGRSAQTMQDNRQQAVPPRSSQLYQTAHWGFIRGAGPGSTVGNREDDEAAMSKAADSGAQKDHLPSSVYNAVTKPYDYTQGYHDLMRHLHERFDNKNDILRVVRALAIVRPSLIALQMPLTEEDEIFVEKCFQRSLIEMDKLISFGGTPAVVWRRTGEICLVGFEFTMLTGWTREELIGKGKYIYELFENQSTVEYYEKFAAHAFENTTQSVILPCVLLKPSGAPVPCAFCFSIKRDIFDLPNMIIGQWLPLL